MELRGTVKQTQAGASVAEVSFGPEVWNLKGQTVTVDGTTARVRDIGDRFKRGGYAYVYLYLDAPAAAPCSPPLDWEELGIATRHVQRAHRSIVRGLDGYELAFAIRGALKILPTVERE